MNATTGILSTPQANAFRAAIQAEPDDATHRLIFADWLDDHARTPLDAAQAELIRVQFALTATTPDDSIWWTLRARERQLLATWHRDLAGPLRKLCRRYRFQGGFLAWAEVDTATFAQHDLFALAPLRSVALVGPLDALRARRLAPLTGLDLRQAQPSPRAHLCRLLEDTRLTALDLPTEFAGQLPAYLSSDAATHLTHLGLTGHDDLARLLLRSSPPARLTSLHLPHYGTADDEAAALARSPWLTTCERLTVGPGPHGLAFFGALSHAPAAIALRVLDLARIDFDALGHARAPGPNLKLLRALTLHGAGFLRNAPADWLRALNLYQLRSLTLREFAPWYDTAAGLFHPPAWPCLHTLELESTQRYTRAAYRPLLTSPLLVGLRRLTLTRVAPDDLLRFLRGGDYTPGSLRELCLRETWFDSPCGQALAAATWLRQLTYLEATGLHADPSNLFDLLLPERFPALTWLDLRGEEVSADLAALLRERFGPGLRLQALARSRSAYHLTPLPPDPDNFGG